MPHTFCSGGPHSPPVLKGSCCSWGRGLQPSPRHPCTPAFPPPGPRFPDAAAQETLAHHCLVQAPPRSRGQGAPSVPPPFTTNGTASGPRSLCAPEATAGTEDPHSLRSPGACAQPSYQSGDWGAPGVQAEWRLSSGQRVCTGPGARPPARRRVAFWGEALGKHREDSSSITPQAEGIAGSPQNQGQLRKQAPG